MRTRNVGALALVGVLAGCSGKAAVGETTAPATAVATTTATTAAPTAPTSPSGAGPLSPLRTVTVSVAGVAKGRPDAMTVSMGVVAMAPTAADALSFVSGKTDALLTTLRQASIADDDIQTSSLGVSPTYDYTQIGPNSVPKLTGYAASNQVTVVIRGVERAGGLIDAAATAVGEGFQMYGGAFSLQDARDKQAEARVDALAKARTHAEQLASASGLRVGPIVAISEGAGGYPNVYYPAGAAAKAAAASAVPIVPGTQTETVVLTVTFELAL